MKKNKLVSTVNSSNDLYQKKKLNSDSIELPIMEKITMTNAITSL